MPRPPYHRQVAFERFEMWLIKLEVERPWSYRFLVGGFVLLFASVCGLVELLVHL